MPLVMGFVEAAVVVNTSGAGADDPDDGVPAAGLAGSAVAAVDEFGADAVAEAA